MLKKLLVNAGLAEETATAQEDKEVVAKAPTAPKKNFGGYQPIPIPMPTVATVSGMSTGIVAADENIVTMLHEAMEKSAVPGYAQFLTVFTPMNGLPDAQRYPMALNVTAATTGNSPDMVVKSLDDRLAILDTERAQFEEYILGETATRVEAKQREVETITKEIQRKREEITTLEMNLATANNDAAQASVEIEQQRATFNASLHVVRGSVEVERNKIAAYILPQTPK